MKKLLKLYDLNSDMQYFELIVESVINGQRKQAVEQFKAMPKLDRKRFVTAINNYWNTGLNKEDINLFINAI